MDFMKIEEDFSSVSRDDFLPKILLPIENLKEGRKESRRYEPSKNINQGTP